MDQGLIAREGEIAAFERFLDIVESKPAAFLVDGEPGIGKTALLAWAVAEAKGRGHRILSATPTRPESRLSFVGLGDLLSGSHGAFVDQPVPQRLALEVALLLRPADEAVLDPRAIGLGLLGALRTMSTSGPVVVAIDDAQWLDPGTLAALSFALRRIVDERIGIVVAARADGDSPQLELPRTITTDRIRLTPLRLGAIQALLADRLQLRLPRTQLLRVYDLCRGNPLLALEVGRVVQNGPLPPPGRPLDLPEDADALFAARLQALPAESLEALAVVAAAAAPTPSLLGAVCAPDGRDATVLDPAIRAGVLRLEAGRFIFTHPLLASAAYGRLDEPARRRLHHRIGEVVADPEERARHLALGAVGPDRRNADALDVAAHLAEARGALAGAAELSELAATLTPPEDAAQLRSRRRETAWRVFLAGDVARARDMLEQLVIEMAPGPERARVLLDLVQTHSGDLKAMLPLLERAVAEALLDDAVVALARRDLAHRLHFAGDPVRALTEARRALEAAERTGVSRVIVPSLTQLAFLELWTGRITPGLLERAVGLESETGYLREHEGPSLVEALRLMWLEDDLASARRGLATGEQIAREHGDDEARAIYLPHMVELECRAGQFGVAADYAAEAIEVREQYGLGIAAYLFWVALPDALRGQVEQARASAERGRALAAAAGNEVYAVRNEWLLGFLALSVGDASAAARILGPLSDRLARQGHGSVRILQVLPDAIEALIAAGQRDAAEAQFAILDVIARDLGTSLARLRATRCRGLLAAARRDHAAALEAYAACLAGAPPDPLERGRTLLALGRTLRRAGRRRDGRQALEEGLGIFETIGALAWAGQARDELGRIGGRVASRTGLTAAEARVAVLVGAGRTNREVAAQLVVTERTVETHLSSIYRKLGVRSRTELARRQSEWVPRSS